MGRKQEAEVILTRGQKENRRTADQELKDDKPKPEPVIATESGDDTNSANILDLFRTPGLRRCTLIM